MATANEIQVKCEGLLQELEIWRFTVSANSDLFNKDPFLKDFLAFKMDITQGYIEESQSWEQAGNETKCKNSIEHAEFFLGQIQAIFDRTFAEQYQETYLVIGERILTDA